MLRRPTCDVAERNDLLLCIVGRTEVSLGDLARPATISVLRELSLAFESTSGKPDAALEVIANVGRNMVLLDCAHIRNQPNGHDAAAL